MKVKKRMCKFIALVLSLVMVFAVTTAPANAQTNSSVFDAGPGYYEATEDFCLCSYVETLNGYPVYMQWQSGYQDALSIVYYEGYTTYGYITGGMGNPSIMINFYVVSFMGTTYYLPEWYGNSFVIEWV